MPLIQHVKSITYADCTDTNKLRPSDWNSSHNQNWTLLGNTLGASTLSGTNIQFAGGNNVTLSVSEQTVTIMAGAFSAGVSTAAGSTFGTTGMASNRLVLAGANHMYLSQSLDGGSATVTIMAPNMFYAYINGNAVYGDSPHSGSIAAHFYFGNSLSISLSSGGAGPGRNSVTVQQRWPVPALSAGSLSDSLTGTYVFSNSNGVSFGMNGSTITASVAGGGGVGVGVKHAGADSTADSVFTSGTVWLSNKYASAGFALQGHNLHFETEVSGASQIVKGYLWPQELSNDYYMVLGCDTLTNQPYIDVWKSDSYYDVHFPMTGSAANNIEFPSFTDSVRRTIETVGHTHTYAASNHSHGVSLNLTNLSGTTAGNSAGITLDLSAGVGGGGVALSAAGSSVSAGTVVFSNSNNVSFGMNGSTITASASYSQSTGPSAIVGSNSTWTSGTVVFSGSNNITVSYNASTLVISGANTHAQQTGISGIAGSAASTVTAGTLVFSNLNGVSFGLNGSTMTASISEQASFGISAAAGSASAGLIVFSNSNNVSFGINGSTITATATIAHTGPVGLAAGASTLTNGTVVFSNLNRVSFGFNGSTVTGSIDAAGTGTTFAGANISASMTLNSNGLNMSASVAAPGAAAEANWHHITGNTAGQSTFSGSTILFEGGDNITLSGVNESRILISAGAAGGGYTKSIKFLHEDFVGFNTGTVASSEGTQYIFCPFHMDNALSCSQIMVLKSLTCATATSSNSSGRQIVSYALSAYIFKRKDFVASSASLTYYTSGSMGFTFVKSHTSNSVSISASWVTNSTGGTSSFSTTSTGSAWQSAISGPRFFGIPMVTSFSAGEWFIAYRHSSTTATTGSNAVAITISGIGYSMQTGIGMVHARIGSSNTNLSNAFHGIGFGSATAVTTTGDMNATVISAGSSALRLQHAVMVNMAWSM